MNVKPLSSYVRIGTLPPSKESPTQPPRRGRRQVCKYFAEIIRERALSHYPSCAHRHSPPSKESPTRPPRRGRRQVCKYLQKTIRERALSPYPSCAHRHSPPFGGVGGGFSLPPSGELEGASLPSLRRVWGASLLPFRGGRVGLLINTILKNYDTKHCTQHFTQRQ